MVKTLYFHFREHGFNPWSGNLRSPQALRYSQKTKKRKGARNLSDSAWKYAGTGALKGHPFSRADLNLERGDPTERPPSKPTYITPFHLQTTWQRGGSDIQGCSGKMSGSCFIHSSLPLVSSVPSPTSPSPSLMPWGPHTCCLPGHGGRAIE